MNLSSSLSCLLFASIVAGSSSPVAAAVDSPRTQDDVTAVAAANATCRVMSILAKKEGDGTIPKNLSALESQLRSDQFAAYKSFELVEQKSTAVNDAQDTSLAMKIGYAVKLKLLAATGPRLKLHLSLTSKGASKPLLDADYSVQTDGVLLVVAGQREGGRALFAFQCRAG